MAKFLSYNLNGIRSAMSKDWINWVKAVNPDVICLQETKAHSDQLDLNLFHELGYKTYWHSAEKKGYSSVAIFSKTAPDHIEYGCCNPKYDCEGRILRADFGDFSALSCYFPSGSSGDQRQAFKMEFLVDFQNYVNDLKKTRQKLLISGDINICHEAIDIHNPVSNKNSSGFLPEEREWMGRFLQSGFIDTFRHLNKEGGNYTWWSYRSGARKRNLGWRIDYHLVTENLLPHLKRSVILPEAIHSDHCPILVEMDVPL